MTVRTNRNRKNLVTIHSLLNKPLKTAGTHNMDNLSNEELKSIILKQNEIIAKLTQKIAELKARLNQNSSNSSKPPSTDMGKPPPRSLREKSGRKPGGQPGHKGHGLKIEREPDETVIIQPRFCEECGSALPEATIFSADTRYVYDVSIEVKLTKYEIQQAICPDCGTQTTAEPPCECKGTINFQHCLRPMTL